MNKEIMKEMDVVVESFHELMGCYCDISSFFFFHELMKEPMKRMVSWQILFMSKKKDK